MYAEAKGITSSTGTDVDTMYGQLLRRMPPGEVGRARFAVVVPRKAVPAAERVSVRVRQLLGIEIYSVDDAGSVVHEARLDDQKDAPTR